MLTQREAQAMRAGWLWIVQGNHVTMQEARHSLYSLLFKEYKRSFPALKRPGREVIRSTLHGFK
jgi:hypothetical protein